MGITPIKDASGLLSALTTQLSTKPAESISPGAGSTGHSVDFHTVWKSQAGKPNGGKEAENLAKLSNDAGSPEGAKRTEKAAEPKESGADSAERKAPAEGDKARDAGQADHTEQTHDAENVQSEDAQGAKDTPIQTIENETKEELLTPEQLLAAQEVLAGLAAGLTDQVAQVLDISPEEVQAVLTEMDLQPADLLDPEIFGEFLPKAMGAEDKLALVTDEASFDQFKELTGELEQILQTGDVFEGKSAGELAEAVRSQMQAQQVQTDAPVLKPESEEAGPAQADTLQIAPEVPEAPLQQMPQNPAPLREEVQERRPEDTGKVLTADHSEESGEIREVTTDDGQTLGAQAMLRNQNRQSEQESGRQEGHQPQPQPQFQMPVQQQVNPEAVAQPREPLMTPQAREIADQILDYIRSQRNEDFSSVEMQLHPASLGSLQIRVANQGGVTTANFITQNEQVKAVLENQLVQLQDQLKEAGVKVEAVEVTVAAHQFEQNLQQGDGSAQNGREQSEGRRVRRLRLGGEFGEDDLEALSEEDRIAAEMMQANGQTVDLQA
ncbi:MAG: flagellar hook-length control protein FliK [Lachnospiraceae bacterium]|nr:flagellar hook-length control protein FliK [Lachnospiraceae bacterium]